MACPEEANFDLNDIPIEEATAFIQQFCQRPVRLGAGVTGLVSLRSAKPVGPEGALRLLLQAVLKKGWQPEVDGAGRLVIRAESLPVGAAGKLGKVTKGVVPRIYVLHHRELSDLLPEIRILLSPAGSIKALDEHSFLVFDNVQVQWQLGTILAGRDVANSTMVMPVREDSLAEILPKPSLQDASDKLQNDHLADVALVLRMAPMLGAIKQASEFRTNEFVSTSNSPLKP